MKLGITGIKLRDGCSLDEIYETVDKANHRVDFDEIWQNAQKQNKSFKFKITS